MGWARQKMRVRELALRLAIFSFRVFGSFFISTLYASWHKLDRMQKEQTLRYPFPSKIKTNAKKNVIVLL